MPNTGGDILSALNPPQREAASTVHGPLLILAGAGSGKTRVITHRIAYLVKQCGVSPYNILAVTFTNKAAAEMKERVDSLIGGRSTGIWVSTFHSTCVRILRSEIEHLGWARNFTIYDSADQLTLVKQCLSELNINEKQFQPRNILGAISNAKNSLLDSRAYSSQASMSDAWEKTVARIYTLYERKLSQNKALDFDDLIMKTVQLFQVIPDVLAEYQERFKYIMVDEYQDTNKAQYILVKMLAQRYRNICCVGDEDQSIYAWRGADFTNILNFEEDYPDAKVVKLEQNYRSTATILTAANRVIKNNTMRKDKALWTDKGEGRRICVYRGLDELDEARYVVRKVEELVRMEERPYGDFAVLYRTNAQSRTFEDALVKAGVPYQLVGGVRFYERKEVKDIMAYLRVIQTPEDTVNLRRIINVPKRGIGESTVDKLSDFADSAGIGLWQALRHPGEAGVTAPKINKALSEFLAIIDNLREIAQAAGVSELVEKVLLHSGYLKELQLENTVESESRIENLKELISVAQEHERSNPELDLAAFLEQVALTADVDSMGDKPSGVTLMTLHTAKGLEFPVVFLVGLEEGIFPGTQALYDDNQLEEERRLAYVGITRAKERLYCTYTWERTLYGRRDNKPKSRFLDEIPFDLLIMADEEDREFRRNVNNATGSAVKAQGNSGYTSKLFGGTAAISGGQTSQSAGIDASTLRVGDKVQHSKFGIGTIVSVKGEGEDATVTIAFNANGIKSFMAGMAPLQKV